MFDKALFVGGQTTHEHITINQQPNDAADAARLYGEIEEKATEKIIAKALLKVGGFEITAVAAETLMRMDMPKTLVNVSFKLNGEIITLQMTLEEFSDTDAIVKHMSEAIANKVMQYLADKAQVQRVFRNRKDGWL